MKSTQSQGTQSQGTQSQGANGTKRKPYNPPRTRRHQGRFGRLALLYYPKQGYKRAVYLFRNELRQTRGLLEALQAVGYRENQRQFTPRQVQVIADFLGEP